MQEETCQTPKFLANVGSNWPLKFWWQSCGVGEVEAGPNISTRTLHGTSKTRRCCTSLSLQSWHSYGEKPRQNSKTGPHNSTGGLREPLGGKGWKEPCWGWGVLICFSWPAAWVAACALSICPCSSALLKWHFKLNKTRRISSCWEDLRQASCAKHCSGEIIIQSWYAAGSVTP